MSLLFSLYAAVDQAFAEVQELHPDEVRCGKGCEDCCHAAFDVSLVEAVNLLRHFALLPVNEQDAVLELAIKALADWDEIAKGGVDPALARIRCPLLNEDGNCRCYEARPVNCRTYGIPTEVNGKGHVCGLSGFDTGTSYPTVNLAQVQQVLYQLSVAKAGEDRARLRWPIAAVLLGKAELDDLLNKENSRG